MNFLEQLAAEWYGYHKKCFIRTNVHFDQTEISQIHESQNIQRTLTRLEGWGFQTYLACEFYPVMIFK